MLASAPKLVAIIMGCRRSEKHMSEIARAMMNQWVAFILFLRAHSVRTTIKFATIDTTTERDSTILIGDNYTYTAKEN